MAQWGGGYFFILWEEIITSYVYVIIEGLSPPLKNFAQLGLIYFFLPPPPPVKKLLTPRMQLVSVKCSYNYDKENAGDSS